MFQIAFGLKINNVEFYLKKMEALMDEKKEPFFP